MKEGNKRILHAALAVAFLGTLGAFYAMPRNGVCVKRNMMFWRTNIESTHLRDNLYMLRAYGTDLINGNTIALVGDEGVLLVDPGHPEMLRKERAALPRMRDSRVRMVMIRTGIPITSAPTASFIGRARSSSVTKTFAIISKRPIGLLLEARAIRRRSPTTGK